MQHPRTRESSSPAGRTRAAAARVSWIAAGVVLSACGGSVTAASAPSEMGKVTKRDTTIQHEECDIGSGAGQDINGDGKPDLAIVTSGGTEKCRVVDLNFDGVWDAWLYNAPDGTVRRRESDFDRDGRVDEIATFKSGVLIAKQRATTLGGKLDTWQYYEGGKLTKTERDSDGDAIIDQWWEYPKNASADCPLVHSDVDGDGRPDPGATVDMCPPDELGDSLDPPPLGNKDPFETEPPPELTETVDGENNSAAEKPNAAPAKEQER